MPTISLEIRAGRELAGRPIIWRLARLFHVVTSVRKARVTPDRAYVLLDLEGAAAEVDGARAYLERLGVTDGAARSKEPTAAPAATDDARPEDAVPQPSAITVRLQPVTRDQAAAPILCRVGKDFQVVVNIRRAELDEDVGGSLEIVISGALMEVQRAIAYLHTTGIHVDPAQRSVTDGGNL